MGKIRAFLVKILSGVEPPVSQRARLLDVEERLEKLERSHADLHAIYLKWRGYAAQQKQQLANEAADEASPGPGPVVPGAGKDALRAIARKKLNRLI